MKENKEKGLADEETMQETHSQPCPVVGSLPSCQSHKKVKHGSSKSGVDKPGFVVPHASFKLPPVQIFDLDSSILAETTPSKPTETTSSKPPKSTPMNFLENEDLFWERFQQAMTDEDVAVCNMSLKEFERSTIHDLFKAMFKFVVASKQATEMDHERVSSRVREVQAECRHQAEVTAKVEEEVKELKNHVEELKNLVEELKADVVEKDTRLDRLQKRSDELCILFEEAKGEAIKEFKASSEFTDLMDENYAARFKDFCKDAIERFPEVDFSSIKFNVAAGSSFLQTSSKDVNIEDDASTQPAVDDPKSGENLLWFIKKESCNCFIYFPVSFILFYFIYYFFYV